MLRLLMPLLVALSLSQAARAEPRWQALPPTPPPVAGEHT